MSHPIDYKTFFTPAQQVSEALTNHGWRWVYQADGPKWVVITLWVRGTEILIQTENREGKCGLFNAVSPAHDPDQILQFIKGSKSRS